MEDGAIWAAISLQQYGWLLLLLLAQRINWRHFIAGVVPERFSRILSCSFPKSSTYTISNLFLSIWYIPIILMISIVLPLLLSVIGPIFLQVGKASKLINKLFWSQTCNYKYYYQTVKVYCNLAGQGPNSFCTVVPNKLFPFWLLHMKSTRKMGFSPHFFFQ